jgi:hypothetical protein
LTHDYSHKPASLFNAHWQILKAPLPLMADLMRALIGFSTLRAVPTAALVAVLRDIVFQPDGLSLRVQTQAIREQAMLTLGAVVSSLSRQLLISRPHTL